MSLRCLSFYFRTAERKESAMRSVGRRCGLSLSPSLENLLGRRIATTEAGLT